MYSQIYGVFENDNRNLGHSEPKTSALMNESFSALVDFLSHKIAISLSRK
ncbi:hypothetical protein VCR29J2_50125 [Vibrio coralliirubri]|nr:hypothetical protein VCR29J2_50125 [Vibrio coralliirubri]